jgi:hypothetical protein
MKKGIIIILIIGFLFCLSILQGDLLSFTMHQSAIAQNETSLSDSKFQIQFKTRVFTPPAQKDLKTFTNMLSSMQGKAAQSVLPSDTMHFLIQFETLPDAGEKKELEAQGIRLIAYVTGNAYIASTRVSKVESLSATADSLLDTNVRWIGALESEDKISEALQKGEIGSWARTDDGRVILTVQFHSDVKLEEAENLLEVLGGEILSKVSTVSSITAVFDVNEVNNIAAEDSVQYVDIVEEPIGDHNDGARNAANVTPLASAPYNLTGAGVTVLVYDSGIIDLTHPDFGTRVIETDTDPNETTRDHSTHVAGTAGGSGANSNGNDSAGNPNGGTANQWAGMAPGVNIRSFGSTGSATDFYDGNGGDLNADFTTAINNGIDLATMSQGHNTTNCNLLGDYTNTAILLDNIVRGSIAGQQLIYFESAGNERGALGCNQFNSISSPATCKNTVVVGALNSDDNTLAGFSSIGPTDDGRLKPDITAPGCQNTGVGDEGITSPSFIDASGDGNLDAGETQNAYVVKCGTSMATPVVAGSTGLLIEQWRSTRGAGTTPLPHTVKAILVHTSTDLGNAGPDYSFGWGALDAQAAVDLVIADDTASLIHVDQVDVGDTDFYIFSSAGIGNVQVTLAWDDPSATRLAATTLINDLDLRLTDPDGVVYQPLILDPANPASAATNGNDATNNVEMVIGNAKAGMWTVSIASTSVPQGPQQYTLITPEDANQPPTCDADGPYTEECQGAITVISLNGTGSSDPEGDPLTYDWTTDCPGGSFDDDTSPTPTLSVDSSNGCNVTCAVSLTVTDAFGLAAMCESQVTIQDTITPDITCPSDITIECDESSEPSNTGMATATDDCDPNPTIGYSDVVTPGDCPNEETITRTWTATDACGKTSSCVQTVEVVDSTPPVIDPNAPDTITPPDAPISFTATATDNCDSDPSVEITGYDCYFFTKKGKRIDKTESCVVEIRGDTITILDSGGVDDQIEWTISAEDNCGNPAEATHTVSVVNPGNP